MDEEEKARSVDAEHESSDNYVPLHARRELSRLWAVYCTHCVLYACAMAESTVKSGGDDERIEAEVERWQGQAGGVLSRP